ncbi:MAG: radical SAM protein [Candidatus Helarchaeota archaeon]
MKISINLTSEIGPFFKIENNKLLVYIHDTLRGTIEIKNLRTFLIKKLKIFDLELFFHKKGKNLLIDIVSNKDLPDKSIILEIITQFISTEIYNVLKNNYTGRRIIYITENSQIPLIGSIYFGIIDRGTNLLQIRPITGCLLNCPFCSVDEGPKSKSRKIDYIIEPKYLFKESLKVIDFKGIGDIEIHIDGQCEPLTYPYLIELIENFSKNNKISVISMQTNGILLNKNLIYKLKKAGLNRINLSINTLNERQAIYLSGTKNYSLKRILKIIDIIKKSKIDLLIAPVIIPSINDTQIRPIIEFILNKKIKSHWPIFGFQNYIQYQYGRKMNVPIKPFRQFNKELLELEKDYGVKLLLTPKDFNIYKIKMIENPIKKESIVNIKVVLPGRMFKNENEKEMIGVAYNRLVHIVNCNFKIGDLKKVYIFRNKHNINYGKPI